MGGALKALNVPPSAATYSAALGGLVGVDEEILRQNPELPLVYASGVKYKLPPHRVWRYPNEIARDGWGDCEGLACWRAAELHVTGADPNAEVVAYRSGPKRFHAIVVRGDGWVEDPSIVCGMKESPGMPWTIRDIVERERNWPRVAGCVVGAIDDAFNDAFLPSLKVVQHGDGFTGVLRLPAADGARELIANTSLSPNAASALKKSQNMAVLISSALDDPYSLAQLNPYSQQAVQVLSDPNVQANLASSKGILTKAGDLLENPAVTKQIGQLGPWGAVASSIINNPLAREARQVSHSVLKQIPLLGSLF